MGHRDVNVKGSAVDGRDDVHYGFAGLVLLVPVVEGGYVLLVFGGVS